MPKVRGLVTDGSPRIDEKLDREGARSEKWVQRDSAIFAGTLEVMGGIGVPDPCYGEGFVQRSLICNFCRFLSGESGVDRSVPV